MLETLGKNLMSKRKKSYIFNRPQ